MTFQEYHLVCPYCGAFSKFYSMMSCTIPYGSPLGAPEVLCTDLHYASREFTSSMGSKGLNVPITCCHGCNRYFQIKTARQFSSYDSPNKSTTLPVIKTEFDARELHEAIDARTFQGQDEERELRLLAWVVSNHPQRETVTSKLVNLDRFYSASDAIPPDLADRIQAFRSLVTHWVDGVDTHPLEQHLRTTSLHENDSVEIPVSSPEFENKIAEHMQIRHRARENLWEKRASEQVTEIEWRIRNLERLIVLMPESEMNFHASTSRKHFTGEDHMHMKTLLKKAEACRQMGRFDESLRQLGEPHQFQSNYQGHRHVARVIHELASRSYRFLWLSVGEEDYTPTELAEKIRNRIQENKNNQNKRELRNAAYQRDHETLKRIILFQLEIEKMGGTQGKTTQQLIEAKLTCPKCQFRYLWDGSRCGHCDKTVFEMDRPDDRAISKLRFQLTGR